MQLYHLVMVCLNSLFIFLKANQIDLGRSLYISKSLDKDNLEKFQSRKVHFGLLGKY
jgi:hypothetical protein